jgi:hypothetical protein
MNTGDAGRSVPSASYDLDAGNRAQQHFEFLSKCNVILYYHDSEGILAHWFPPI